MDQVRESGGGVRKHVPNGPETPGYQECTCLGVTGWAAEVFVLAGVTAGTFSSCTCAAVAVLRWNRVQSRQFVSGPLTRSNYEPEASRRQATRNCRRRTGRASRTGTPAQAQKATSLPQGTSAQCRDARADGSRLVASQALHALRNVGPHLLRRGTNGTARCTAGKVTE